MQLKLESGRLTVGPVTVPVVRHAIISLICLSAMAAARAFSLRVNDPDEGGAQQ